MDISKQYEKAGEAVERGNDDYAIQLLQDVLSIRPDHLDSRKMLRNTVRKKFRKAGVKSAGFAAYVKGIAPLVKMGVSTLMKKHDQAMIEGERFLTFDPDNKLALTMLGKSAGKLANCKVTAIWVFQSILEKDPTDTKALKTLGQFFEDIDDVLKATECYERILQIRPADRDMELKLRDLAARKTIKAGWDKAGEKGAFKNILRDTNQMEDRSGEEQLIRTDDDLSRNIERVKGDIEKEPDNKQYVIQLGDLYRRGKEYDASRQQYMEAKQLDERDFSIDERLGDLKIEIFNDQIDQLEESIRKGTADESGSQRLKEIVAERDTFSTEEFKKRIAQRPTDLPLRYRLGMLLYNAGNIDDALAEFQQAVKSPQHKRTALTYCGMCLFKKNMHDMAVQMFENALEGSIVVGREEMNLLYNLGVAAEKLGDFKKAEDSYKKIFNADINFRDVKDKIEALYKKRQAHEAGEQQGAS